MELRINSNGEEIEHAENRKPSRFSPNYVWLSCGYTICRVEQGNGGSHKSFQWPRYIVSHRGELVIHPDNGGYDEEVEMIIALGHATREQMFPQDYREAK